MSWFMEGLTTLPFWVTQRYESPTSPLALRSRTANVPAVSVELAANLPLFLRKIWGTLPGSTLEGVPLS